ncbi:YdcF family protein [Gaetbulibacter saemankumensis]|uniref:YdcF family protein n=1 Tax=Gaetbulibacter saemankumensis TaxID=311208 RepID=UPI0004081681|nr:YdcF family protein [Gaetbulibacter saemankumensis]
MSNKIIIVLGAPNSPKGILSSIAENRLNLCFKMFSKGDLILCTGGWGKHFNNSSLPHSHYAQEYLLNKGISKSCFLEPALSSNTVDDAVKTKEIIYNYKNLELLIITSDFHLDRAKLIFKEILKEYTIGFIGAKNNLPKNQLQKIIEHEKKSINEIVKNGLYY